jgi:hypothetical protein
LYFFIGIDPVDRTSACQGFTSATAPRSIAKNNDDVSLYKRATHRRRLGGGFVTVITRVTGEFPGSPIELRYRFTLDGDKIARLEITA